jgi:GNAT superfamily N-acetyltransferase
VKGEKVDNYQLKYHFVKVDSTEEELRKQGFAIEDLVDWIRKKNNPIAEILVIDSIIVDSDSRNKGLGSKIIKDFCESYSNYLILVIAGANTDEYKNEPTDEQYSEILERLNRFYTRLGFISVNNRIGCYDYKESFIYGNKVGRKLTNEE